MLRFKQYSFLTWTGPAGTMSFDPVRGSILLGTISIPLLGMLLSSCKRVPSPPPPPIPSVTVATPIRKEVLEWDDYAGYLAAVDMVEVRARVSGMIKATPFHEGAIVNKDDVLVKIDEAPFQADLDSKLADQARAAAQVELADIEYRRVQKIPTEAVMNVELDRVAATLRQEQAGLAAAKAAVESSQLNLSWCNVTAPVSGRVSRKLVTAGNLITGGTAQATLLTTIASIDPIYCYVDADERSVLKYERLALEGKRKSARDVKVPCYLQLADETGFPHAGVIDFVDNRVDPTTGTMRGRGIFPNPDGRLVPGFYARIRLPGSGKYEAMLVPDSALIIDQSQKALLVVGTDNIVAQKFVKTGALFGDLRAIESGIELSDRIIINGLMLARSGAKVNPKETSLSASLPEMPSAMPTSASIAPTNGSSKP
ncbi:MAG: efflux RND transporter periplasmic adaptor subunit [Planctomycetes bacterium]|nr:efflux RND transporter periplasmic adaptor subunit [Planctomycetota bacterium]